MTYKTREWTEKKIRMVPKMRKIRKRIPAHLNVTFSCPCYDQNCGCLGQENCNCCFPKCGCAPKTIYQNVEILKKIMVPEIYNATKVEEIPVLKTVTTPEYVPVKNVTYFIEKVPVITESWESYEVPYIELVDKIIQEPQNMTTTVTEDMEEEVEVEIEYKVPITDQVEVMVDTAVEEDRVFTISMAEEVLVKEMRNVPVVEEETIPDPPCHWHEIEHSHGVELGKMHKHNM